MKKLPSGFLWGAASSAPQFEGAGNEGGKGNNVWDYWFQEEPKKFYQQLGPKETSSFYHQYKEDILLMKEIGFNSFRTSISWSRLIPKRGKVNQEAIIFYREVLKRLIENGIEPIINLYHFDMPYRLHIKGGWENQEVVEEFIEYATVAFENFGDLVKKWVTFNEPIVPIEMGYLNNMHLPAIFDFTRAFQTGFHTQLAHAGAVKTFKEGNFQGEIGIILNLTPSYPRSQSKEDQEAAFWADIIFNRSFLDPSVHGTYPPELLLLMENEGINIVYTEEQLELIKGQRVDFLGVNYYQPRRVQSGDVHSTSVNLFNKYFQPYHWEEAKMNPHRGWEIYEKGLYDIAINIRDYYFNIPWFVAENGIGVEGEEAFMSEESVVQDDYRIEFMTNHLNWLQQAIEEGANCYGYHVWTFIDNWSWLNEYKNRYGLVRLDLETKKRHKKKSAYWFKALAQSNQLPETW
ncbi:glycoside hydrolase family 1 protein [Alkalihalobacillus sp. 1P02AB]|uniref:glycoside hydrolase family 1 protein n=1 Tax=Alkalihalobacillus sp. 1P02AB TaxID=3132260 RepID=UPI0039A43DB1